MSLDAASAGDFSLDLGTNPDWPTNGVGPVNVTLTDQYGFQLDVQMDIARIGGTPLAGWPDETAIFGTSTSLGVVWDAGDGLSLIGGSTNTATMQFSSVGAPFGVDSLSFVISDIDSVDNNSFADRCDFITVTGDAGTPSLAPVIPGNPATSVIVGPGPGSGNTGTLAANQAQCIYNLGAAATSPNSNGDDNGSVLATWPAGTSVATVLFDESIQDVWGFTGFNAAARGTGIWSATAIVVNTSISMTKSADLSFFSAGDTITYTYEVTNTGRLPILPSQDIVIDDDVIGQFTCPAVTSIILPGGTFNCTATYVATAADVTAGSITNTAVAGVGSPGQSFATRLQSGSDAVTIPAANPSLIVTKVADQTSNVPAGVTVTYTYVVTNNGNQTLTNVTLTDSHNGSGPPPVPGNETLTADNGPTADSTDAISDGIWDTLAPGDEVTFTASYIVTQNDLDTLQ